MKQIFYSILIPIVVFVSIGMAIRISITGKATHSGGSADKTKTGIVYNHF